MKFVIVSGDQAVFEPSFAPATLIAPPPGTIVGTGRANVFGSPVCVVGDEASVVVPTSYAIGTSTPGSGVLRITGLGADQQSVSGQSDQRALIVAGTRFRASLTVVTPTTTGGSPVDSPGTVYAGGGQFVTQNTKTKG